MITIPAYLFWRGTITRDSLLCTLLVIDNGMFCFDNTRQYSRGVWDVP